MTEYLNYQGSELAKSLLLFSKGEKVYKTDIESINFLKIFGANCFGNKLDKASFVDRIKWVEDNIENIKKFDNGILISKSENKLLFISFCFEFNNYLNSLRENLPYFITHLPVQLDASCNGFQHLTFLIGDLALSEELNLSKSNWTETPKDFYSFIALKVKEFFNKELYNNKDLSIEEFESYKKLANLDIYRALYKKVIMTWPYNVSSYSMTNYFKEEFNFIEKDKYMFKFDNNIIFKEIDFQILRKALISVLLNDFPRLKSFINYLKDIAKISNELEIQIPWILPTGLIVQQQYYAKKKIKVKPYIYSKDLLTLNIPIKTKFNTQKQIRAFMPNLVHSLDAATLSLLIDIFFKENKYQNFYSVHDCFAVTCNNVTSIYKILKAVYAAIYSKEPYLKELHEYFLKNIEKLYGSNSYNSKENTITIFKNNEYKFIKYPDIKKVINIHSINIEESSYLIH